MSRTITAQVTGEFCNLSGKQAGVQGESNAVTLLIDFDESWDGFAKRIVWRDARGENPVAVVLTGADLVDVNVSSRAFTTAIPGEPLALSGWCSFTIDGYLAATPNVIQKSVTERLEVSPNDSVYQPAEPTPTQAQQLMDQINHIIAGDVAIADLVRSGDIRWVRLHADGGLEVSLDGETYSLISSSGHIVLDANGGVLPQRTRMRFADSTVIDQDGVTVVQGIQGPPGETGPQGAEGPQGLPGPKGAAWFPAVDALGQLSFVLSDTETPPPVSNIRGPQGAQGIQGPQGIQGAAGPQGIAGQVGAQGPRGVQGETGPQGATGATGPQGPYGPQGQPGQDGADGRHFVVQAIYGTLAALQTAHPTGQAGDAYAVGSAVNNTVYIWDGDTETWADIGGLLGPQGPQGEAGPQGPLGPTGQTGPAGPQGIQGPVGLQGPQGLPGATGTQGPKGEQGDAATVPYATNAEAAAGSVTNKAVSPSTLAYAIGAAAPDATQAEAEAGIGTAKRSWTPLRVAQAARKVLLTGLTTAASSAIAATDTLLSALAKLQAQAAAAKTAADTAQATANGKAVRVQYTATIPVLSASTSYTAVTVNGLLAGDVPIVDLTGTTDAQRKDWSKITRIEVVDNAIRVYRSAATTGSIPIQLLVIR